MKVFSLSFWEGQKVMKKYFIVALVTGLLFAYNTNLAHTYYKENQELKEDVVKQSKLIKQFTSYTIELTTKIDQQQEEISDLEQQIGKKNKEIKKLTDELEYEKTNKVFEVTAYTANEESTGKTPAHKYYGVTASGKKVKENRTIACPPSLKFGTKLIIEGIGLRVCEDRGGAIKEGHLDLYVENLTEAISFGRRILEVQILIGAG